MMKRATACSRAGAYTNLVGPKRTTGSEAADVREAAGDRADLVEPVEQHRRRVPLPAGERVAKRRRKARLDVHGAGGDDAGADVRVDESLGRALDERLQRVDALVICAEAGDPEHGG